MQRTDSVCESQQRHVLLNSKLLIGALDKELREYELLALEAHQQTLEISRLIITPRTLEAFECAAEISSSVKPEVEIMQYINNRESDFVPVRTAEKFMLVIQNGASVVNSAIPFGFQFHFNSPSRKI